MRVKFILLLLAMIALVLVAIWGLPKLQRFLAIDDCLARGGSWHYDVGECSFTENYGGPR